MTAVEKLEIKLLGLISFDSEELRAKYKEAIKQAKEMEKENQKHIGQITEKGIIDTIGNCANCGVEFHIHKDITENQQQQGYSEEEAIEFFIEGYKQRAEKSDLIFDNASRMYAIALFKQFKKK